METQMESQQKDNHDGENLDEKKVHEKIHESPKMHIILFFIALVSGCIGYLLNVDTLSAKDHPYRLSVSQLAMVETYVVSVGFFIIMQIHKYFFRKSTLYERVSTDVNLEFQSQKNDASSLFGIKMRDLEEILGEIVKYGTVMMFYVYTSATGRFAADREYSRDFFWGLMMMFLLASLLTVQKSKAHNCGIVINRDQTEEWKGWMQIIFLAYHYFHAGAEIYNLVRVLIGAYVWMTGFGHFIYFSTKKRFDLIRVIRTILRLNFLVIFTCFATDNELMLYYICPMHTFWFFFVYFTMYIYRSRNHEPKVMVLKFLISFIFITVLFESRTVFNLFFWPLKPLLSYSLDGDDTLHEWYFRLGLDHYIAWIGMVCGYFKPTFQKKLDQLEKKPGYQQWYIKVPITIFLLFATYCWYKFVFVLNKFDYNKLHPYWEFVPILTWLWCRNLTKRLRSYYINMFAWWGRLTLESYISQLHILLTNNAKSLILLFPGYRVITMVVMSIFFSLCSKILFEGSVYFSLLLASAETKTNTQKDTNWGIPMNYISTIKNFLLVFAIGSLFFTTAAVIHLTSN